MKTKAATVAKIPRNVSKVTIRRKMASRRACSQRRLRRIAQLYSEVKD